MGGRTIAIGASWNGWRGSGVMERVRAGNVLLARQRIIASGAAGATFTADGLEMSAAVRAFLRKRRQAIPFQLLECPGAVHVEARFSRKAAP